MFNLNALVFFLFTGAKWYYHTIYYKKGLVMHERKKHRISHVYGMDDFHEETSTALEILTLDLDELGGDYRSKTTPQHEATL